MNTNLRKKSIGTIFSVVLVTGILMLIVTMTSCGGSNFDTSKYSEPYNFRNLCSDIISGKVVDGDNIGLEVSGNDFFDNPQGPAIGMRHILISWSKADSDVSSLDSYPESLILTGDFIYSKREKCIKMIYNDRSTTTVYGQLSYSNGLDFVTIYVDAIASESESGHKTFYTESED
jgi:hypothetical protein